MEIETPQATVLAVRECLGWHGGGYYYIRGAETYSYYIQRLVSCRLDTPRPSECRSAQCKDDLMSPSAKGTPRSSIDSGSRSSHRALSSILRRSFIRSFLCVVLSATFIAHDGAGFR
jgi:hypothetical protein